MKQKLSYHPGNSILHRLHPLLKLAWLGVLTALVFLSHAAWVPLLLTLLLLLIFVMLRIPLKKMRGIRVLFITALVIALLQVIFLESGEIWLTLGPVAVTGRGVSRGLYLAGRFLAVVFLGYVFVLTTAPDHLAYALMRAGLPYRFGFAFVTALRLIPIFEEEALTVYRAQLVRGVSYDRRNIPTLIRSFRRMLLPMLISAIRKVDSLAVSMEGRCYGRYRQRTYYRTWKPGSWDGALGLMLVLVILGFFSWLTKEILF